VERTTWLTEERIVASATGAPARGLAAAGAMQAILQIQKRAGFVPPVSGPGLVCGSSTVSSTANDHAALGRTAWDGTPLGSPGAGNG
jgi:hypothetical protein